MAARRHLNHEFLERRAPELVIDRAESGDTQLDERQSRVAKRRVREAVLDESHPGPAVGQSGPRIAARFVAETLLEQLPGRDVDVEQHEPGTGLDGRGRRVQQEPPVLDR